MLVIHLVRIILQIFNGVKVIKSQTAEMQEGGISGTIDQGLRGPLGRKDSFKN